MKKLINLTATLFLFSLSLTGGNQKGKVTSGNDSLYCIEIDGKVLIPKSDSSKIYKIELLCHNTVVETATVVDDESFLLKVKKNSWYTIRIVKEGYFPQIVSINTKLPDYNTDSHKFHFDTELIKEGTHIQDEESVEFPISIVAYNKSIDTFSPVQEYSENIQRSMFEVQPINEGFVKNDRSPDNHR